jgi:hypothetical protein
MLAAGSGRTSDETPSRMGRDLGDAARIGDGPPISSSPFGAGVRVADQPDTIHQPARGIDMGLSLRAIPVETNL